MLIKVPMLTCQRCGWKWTPRKADVRVCPKCNSASWDKPEGK
jgi:predicted Zn-ribbon and HTH transcriptional regulator